MRSKISKRLTTANALLLIGALLIFCILSITIFSVYLRTNIKEQLVRENEIATRLAQLSATDRSNTDEENGRKDFTTLQERLENYKQPAVYSTLAESTSIILVKYKDADEYEVIYPSAADFGSEYNLNYIESRLTASNDNVIQVKLNGTNYFLTAQEVKTKGFNQISLYTMSLIPISSLRQIIRQYILMFLITTVFLVLLSVTIISLISNRITTPIAKLTNLTDEYAKRDFNHKYIADTNDEIEDLSKSINQMANALEEHDTQREKMFRHISHELKTPLTAIYGYAEGIKNGVFQKADEPLDIIMSESLRIKKLTEDIIYLSKLESNIEVFKMEQCDISSIMIKAIQSIESIAIMQDIDIRYMPKEMESITADEDKIHRALINILSNCVKHTKDVIDIGIHDKGQSVEIVIADNGDGFKDEDIKNLLSGMTKEKSNGSGIGLSIVNEIVAAHKGEFYIGNNKLGGAIFTIVLRK